jgi:hypothetical protein
MHNVNWDALQAFLAEQRQRRTQFVTQQAPKAVLREFACVKDIHDARGPSLTTPSELVTDCHARSSCSTRTPS